MPMTSPVKPGRFWAPTVMGVRPGRIFSSSAALRPTMEMFSIWSAVRVALFSPEFRGTIGASEVTTSSSATPPTSRRICPTVRLSPIRIWTPVLSVVLKPPITTRKV